MFCLSHVAGSIQHIGWSTCINNWPKESICSVYMTTNLLCYVKRAVISIFVFMPNTLDQVNTYCKYIYNDFYMDIRNDLTTLPAVIIWQEKSTVLHLCEICGTFYIFHKMLEKFWHTMLFWLNSEAPVFRISS